jgi:hypothetical protein
LLEASFSSTLLLLATAAAELAVSTMGVELVSGLERCSAVEEEAAVSDVTRVQEQSEVAEEEVSWPPEAAGHDEEPTWIGKMDCGFEV